MTVSQKAKTAQQARTKARERRLAALDTDRAARDKRIETAAAAVFLGLDDLAAARLAVGQVEDGIGDALRDLVNEGLSVEQAAELCELSVAEVRKLTRRKPAADAGKSNGAPARE